VNQEVSVNETWFSSLNATVCAKPSKASRARLVKPVLLALNRLLGKFVKEVGTRVLIGQYGFHLRSCQPQISRIAA